MNFKTHNEVSVDINFTHLQGYVNADYATLCEVFGKPQEGDGCKVDAEWWVRFDDGLVATIYNWKNGLNYMGARGTPVEQIDVWHIGGHSAEAAIRIKALVEQHAEEYEDPSDYAGMGWIGRDGRP